MVQPIPKAEPVPPPPISTASPDPAATRSLADIIRALEVPEEERKASVAAVDLAEVAALQERQRAARQAGADKAKRDAEAKAKAEADAKAKAEAAEKARLAKNPSRHWFQLASGRGLDALAFDMRNIRRKHAVLMQGKDAWTAPWGRTNRLVVGPFTTAARAKAFEAEYKKAGGDGFTWQSEAGEEVKPLGGK